jgi:plastocyanin
MNKKALIIIALIVTMGAIFLIWRSGQEKGAFQSKVSQAQSSLAADNAKEVSVRIEGYAFKREIIKIKKGTKVTWTNQDSAKHTVTSDSGKDLASAAFGNGGIFSKVFEQAGTYMYHCEPHPSMLGAVIVID